MTPKHYFDTAKFDTAVSQAFQNDPGCGALGEVDALRKRRDVNDILAMAALPREKLEPDDLGHGSTKKIILLASAAALLLTVVAGTIIYNLSSRAPLEEATHQTNPSWFGEVQSPGTGLFLGQTLAVTNAPVPVNELLRVEEGEAILRLPTGIDWRMKEQASGKIRPVTADQLKVSLQSGENWFRVNPERKGPAFSVDTPLGQIQVTGTIFVVDVHPKDVQVALLKGEVWVTLPSGKRSRLKAGYAMHLNDRTQAPLSAETLARYEQQLSDLSWIELKRELAANAELQQDDGAPLPAAGMLLRENRNTASPQTQAQLLRSIRKERQQQNWGKVAELYRKLIKMSPGSETSTVARVSLGEVYISKLHRYNEALTLFNRYLQSGHTALLPEATFGKCNALKQLGKTAQETQCLKHFVARYPKAFQTPDAQHRLSTLRD